LCDKLLHQDHIITRKVRQNLLNQVNVIFQIDVQIDCQRQHCELLYKNQKVDRFLQFKAKAVDAAVLQAIKAICELDVPPADQDVIEFEWVLK
jgi:hypothetical protein